MQSLNTVIRNTSNLDITDQPRTIIHQNIYHHNPQIILKDKPKENTYFETKTYKNPITMENYKYKVLKTQENQNSHTKNIASGYRNWLQNMKTFQKPYSQNTKYIDNLSQHKNLIRRGPFNIPLHKEKLSRQANFDPSLNKQKSFQNSRYKSISHSTCGSGNPSIYNSIFRTKKQIISSSLNYIKKHSQTQQGSQLSLKKPAITSGYNSFDNSLKSKLHSYQTLKYEGNFDNKQDQIRLKNSISKLLAADLIKEKLINNSLTAKNNLNKIKKKINFGNRAGKEFLKNLEQ